MNKEELKRKIDKLEVEWAESGMTMGIPGTNPVKEHRKDIIRRAMYLLNSPDIDIFEALEKQWTLMISNPGAPGESFEWVERANKILEEEKKMNYIVYWEQQDFKIHFETFETKKEAEALCLKMDKANWFKHPLKIMEEERIEYE